MTPPGLHLREPGNDIHSRNILLERNVILYITEFDEFHQELERWN